MNRRHAIKLASAALCSCCVPRQLFGQEILEAEWKCSFTGDEFNETIYTYASDREAASVVENILKYTGLKQNFVIAAANVPNAMATIRGTKRYILYNQQFMMQIKGATQTDWAGTSILAHEIGHHLQGHTVEGGGSRPPIELEADKYSGFVLQRMGASLNESKKAMEALGSETQTPSHPAKRDRLVAITAGWMEARDLAPIKKEDIGKAGTEPVNQKTVPDQPQQPPSTRTPQQPQPVARCVFQADPNVYLVLSNDDIISFNPYGQPVLIGKRLPPNQPGLAWLYQTAHMYYGVDSQGRILGRNPLGQVFQVGYVTNP